jgi:Domain of unknown function (DUF4307)
MAGVTDLDARYGRRPPRSPARRTTLALVGVGLAVLGVVAFFAWSRASADDFSAVVQSYSVDSDTQVSAAVEVTNHSDLPVRCEIVAKDRYTQVVGTSVVEGPATGGRTVVSTAITTTGRAVVAVVRDCAAASARVP